MAANISFALSPESQRFRVENMDVRPPLPLEFRISYLLVNNIEAALKSRPVDSSLPEHWPYDRFNSPPKERNDDEAVALLRQHSSLVSSNINIVLCLAAALESNLEALLIAPFDRNRSRDEFDALSVSIFREELIKLSSLERYFAYYAKIYGAKPRELLSSKQSSCFTLLFNIRNMIIHASALQARVIFEPNRAYAHVDDPFYLDIVKASAALLNLPDNFYCLPESLLACNLLVDTLRETCWASVSALRDHVTKKWPELKSFGI